MGKRKFCQLLYKAASEELKEVDTTGVEGFSKRVARKMVRERDEKKRTVIDLTKDEDVKPAIENEGEKTCYYGDYCSRWIQCTFSHGEPSERAKCPFGGCNGIYPCIYKHNNDDELKESGKVPCVWGPWCYFTECQYWHPKRLVVNLGVRYHDHWYDICQLCGLCLYMCQDSSPVVKTVHVVDQIKIYQCQVVEYGVQCSEKVEEKYLCDKHHGWFG